jgi:response regulator RpfG family c-di-GMP phosphodiesterase
MSDKLNVIIVDDQPDVCELISQLVGQFYVWGDIQPFTDPDVAIKYLRSQGPGIAVFIVDVFLGDKTAFDFLGAIGDKFPMAYEDTVIVTGKASIDVVNMCVASNISYLVEKPIRPYTLQMAVRAIVSKYIRFARKLLEHPELAGSVLSFDLPR